MAPQGRRCATCGSKRFHKDAASGQIVCEDGHVVESFTQEAEGDRISHSQRTRKEKKEKKVKEKPVSAVYRGSRARFLQLQALQYLLRQQIAALRETFGYPEELEIISRDLWACYVSSIDLDPEPLLAKDRDASPAATGSQVPSRASTLALIPESDAEMSRRMDLDVLSDDESEESDGTAATSATMRSRSVSAVSTKSRRRKKSKAGSTADGDVEEAEEERKKGRHYPTNELDPRRAVHAWYTLVIIYLSLLTLRAPIMVNDLIHLALVGKLPYLNAIDGLPEGMWKHIHADLRRQLDVPHVPKVVVAQGEQGLYGWVRRFAELYRSDYGITFPELNVPPLLWRSRSTAVLYVSARYLIDRIDLDLAVGSNVEDSDEEDDVKKSKSSGVRGSVLPAEVNIIAAVVLCIRLLWTLDAEERAPFDLDDPLSALFDREAFLRTLDRMNDLEAEADPASDWRRPIESLDEDQIDAYLDHVERTLDRPSHRPADIEMIDRIFPRAMVPTSADAGSSSTTEADKVVSALYASMRPPALSQHDGTAFLPLKRYHPTDTVGQLPEAIDKVVKRAARLVGISAEEMLKAVGVLESKLLSGAKRVST